jgi:hypothetical protein
VGEEERQNHKKRGQRLCHEERLEHQLIKENGIRGARQESETPVTASILCQGVQQQGSGNSQNVLNEPDHTVIKSCRQQQKRVNRRTVRAVVSEVVSHEPVSQCRIFFCVGMAVGRQADDPGGDADENARQQKGD